MLYLVTVDDTPDYGTGFNQLLLCDDQRWGQSDDVIVSRLGQQSSVPQLQTHVPRCGPCVTQNFSLTFSLLSEVLSDLGLG